MMRAGVRDVAARVAVAALFALMAANLLGDFLSSGRLTSLLLLLSETLVVVPDILTATVSVSGLMLVIAGKRTLGRSFGIAPGNWGIVIGGPYSFVRHPIYTGYLVTHLAFLLANPTPLN